MEMVVTERSDEKIVIALRGQLDSAGADEIGSRFVTSATRSRRPVIVDLSELTFLMSRGITMLTRCATALRTVGVNMVLLNPQPMVKEVLLNASLDKVFPIASSLPEAESMITEK